MIRPLFGSALGLALLTAAPAAFAQAPQGIVLNPGERLVSPLPPGVTVTYRTTAPATAASTPAAAPQGSRVVTVGGVQPAGGATAATPRTTYRPAPPMPGAVVQTNYAPQPVGGNMYGGSDQARAQAEANLMAARGIRGHVGGTIGRFEGVGWSTGGMPNTCTPPRPMTLTADAIARGPGGVYRVRAWR
ncbi:MAG: hypothetical protein AAF907_14305 [Planctomycetota bacterium]